MGTFWSSTDKTQQESPGQLAYQGDYRVFFVFNDKGEFKVSFMLYNPFFHRIDDINVGIYFGDEHAIEKVTHKAKKALNKMCEELIHKPKPAAVTRAAYAHTPHHGHHMGMGYNPDDPYDTDWQGYYAHNRGNNLPPKHNPPALAKGAGTGATATRAGTGGPANATESTAPADRKGTFGDLVERVDKGETILSSDGKTPETERAVQELFDFMQEIQIDDIAEVFIHYFESEVKATDVDQRNEEILGRDLSALGVSGEVAEKLANLVGKAVCKREVASKEYAAMNMFAERFEMIYAALSDLEFIYDEDIPSQFEFLSDSVLMCLQNDNVELESSLSVVIDVQSCVFDKVT